MEHVKLNVTSDNKELIIRTGEAEENIPNRKSIRVTGNLDTALQYLKNPPAAFMAPSFDGWKPFEYTNLRVNRDEFEIVLTVDEGCEWQSNYVGKLKYDEVFKKFGINANRSFTTLELSDLIKMHRSYFETKDVAMKLVSELRNFKGKVDKEIENADDNRGNKRILYQQAVDSNIPSDFKVNLPVFKGYEKQVITLEIAIDASDFSCRLISPEAMDYVNELSDGLIDEQLDSISKLFPKLKIFEV